MKTTLFVLTLIFSLNSFADGSIGKLDAIKEVALENKALARTLLKLDLEDQGMAVRVGRHLGASGGSRIMPFTFATKDGKLDVTIDYDASGAITVTLTARKATREIVP